jgi:hypothetical protein
MPAATAECDHKYSSNTGQATKATQAFRLGLDNNAAATRGKYMMFLEVN